MNEDELRDRAARLARAGEVLLEHVPAADTPPRKLVEWIDLLLLRTADEYGRDFEPEAIAHDVVDGTHLVVNVASAFEVIAACPTLAQHELDVEVGSPADAVFAVFTMLGFDVVVAEVERLRAASK